MHVRLMKRSHGEPRVSLVSMVSLVSARNSSSSLDSRFDLPDIPLKPHQPTNFAFPKRRFGQTKVVYRSFQALWFRDWPFLHYEESSDSAYCHTCVTAFKEKKIRSPHADAAFVRLYKLILVAIICCARINVRYVAITIV